MKDQNRIISPHWSTDIHIHVHVSYLPVAVPSTDSILIRDKMSKSPNRTQDTKIVDPSSAQPSGAVHVMTVPAEEHHEVNIYTLIWGIHVHYLCTYFTTRPQAPLAPTPYMYILYMYRYIISQHY